MAIKKKLTVTKTARYFQSKEITDKTKFIWFVCHGYGQLAEFFIRKFNLPEHHVVIAPEGLHRYYLEGSSGRVGASWMTKEEREDDIHDYVLYLDQLYFKIEQQHPDIKKIILGFSQGVATAARWVGLGKINPHHFVMWAGVFPPDMNFNAHGEKWKDLNCTMVFGDQDEYYTATAFEEMGKNLLNSILKLKLMRYSGGHQIEPGALEKLVHFM